MLALHGVDVYIRSGNVPEAPEAMGALSRSFISDRGTRVQNPATHDTRRTEIYCVRYESETALADSDIDALLEALSGAGFDWPKVQKLYRFENGDKAYSQPY